MTDLTALVSPYRDSVAVPAYTALSSFHLQDTDLLARESLTTVATVESRSSPCSSTSCQTAISSPVLLFDLLESHCLRVAGLRRQTYLTQLFEFEIHVIYHGLGFHQTTTQPCATRIGADWTSTTYREP